MLQQSVQRILIAYIRREAPQTYAAKSIELRDCYASKLLSVRDDSERRAVGREYRQAKATLVISLARLISTTG